MVVSRRWQKAVLSMKPLALSTDIMEANLLLHSGCMSRLCRYVTVLTAVASSPVALHEMLASIASQLPHLRILPTLRCSVITRSRSFHHHLPPFFPAGLQSLSLQLIPGNQKQPQEEGNQWHAPADYFNRLLDDLAGQRLRLEASWIHGCLHSVRAFFQQQRRRTVACTAWRRLLPLSSHTHTHCDTVAAE